MTFIKNIVKFFAFGLIATIFITGCKVGPDFEKSDTPTAATFRYDSLQADTVVNLRWWELFNNPELDSLIVTGLRENKDVLTAASRVEQAMITVGFTKVDIYPSIGVTGAASVGNVLGNQPLGADAGIYLAGLTMAWEIDFWGKFRRATEAARANYVASGYAQRTIQIGLITAITQTYFQLLDFRWRLQIAEHTLDSRQKAVEIINARFKQGIVPRIDLNQAQIQLAIAKSSVPFYKRQIAITETALAVLLGRNPYEIIAEVKKVLLYPRLQKLHHHTPKQIDEIVGEFIKFAYFTSGLWHISAIKDDPTDDKYLECAVEASANFIISGDHHLTDLKSFQGIKIILPAEFLKLL